MTQLRINLHSFFDLPQGLNAPQILCPIPLDEVFYRQDQMATELKGLKGRAENLLLLQDRLKDATTHQIRDRIIACAVVAIAVGLVTGVILIGLAGTELVMIPVVALILNSLICSLIVSLHAEADQRPGFKPIQYADILLIGIFRITHHFLTRKSYLTSEENSLKLQVKNDLIKAGKYLKTNLQTMREELIAEKDIKENSLRSLDKAKDIDSQSIETQNASSAAKKRIQMITCLLEMLTDLETDLVQPMETADLFLEASHQDLSDVDQTRTLN